VLERIKTGEKPRFTSAESLGPLVDDMVAERTGKRGR